MAKNLLSGEGVKSLPSKYKEEGTEVSGYATNGPYHCEDCIHRIGGLKSDLPFCIHPKVLEDPKLKKLRTIYDGTNAVEIDMEHGCCRFVKQQKDHKD